MKRICVYKDKRCSARTCRYYYNTEATDICDERTITCKEAGTFRAMLLLRKWDICGIPRKGAERRTRLLIKLMAQEAARLFRQYGYRNN